jgi:8-oxo-dGTP diphosphatase
MQEYVAGLALSESHQLLLVRKKRPEWQRGLLNAVGGKIEDGETPEQAMAREFLEETGYSVSQSQFRCFCVERHPEYEVHFFRTTLSDWECDQCGREGVNDAGEELRWVHVGSIEANCGQRIVGNLHWLIPMALDWREFECLVTTSENISGRPT